MSQHLVTTRYTFSSVRATGGYTSGGAWTDPLWNSPGLRVVRTSIKQVVLDGVSSGTTQCAVLTSPNLPQSGALSADGLAVFATVPLTGTHTVWSHEGSPFSSESLPVTLPGSVKWAWYDADTGLPLAASSCVIEASFTYLVE